MFHFPGGMLSGKGCHCLCVSNSLFHMLKERAEQCQHETLRSSTQQIIYGAESQGLKHFRNHCHCYA